MPQIPQVAAWLWRAWPAIMVAVVSLIHFAALGLFAEHNLLVNKLTGTILQVVGGLIVLHSLDGNLGLFKKQSLIGSLVLWIRQFPTGRNQTVQPGGVGIAGEIGVAGALAFGKAAPKTLEERVTQLELELGEERKRLRELEASTSSRLAILRAELTQSIASVEATVSDLGQKVERSAIGGLKQQLFGVLLALYGAVVSAFA